MTRRIDIEEEQKRLCISFPYDRKLVDVVRAMPARWFDRESKAWYVPLSQADEVVGRLRHHGFNLSDELEAFFKARGVDLEEITEIARQTHKPFIKPEMLPDGTWTVDKLNHKVQEVMRDTFREELWLASEIQSFDRNRRRGHAFFELVHRPHQGGDPSARVSAVLWGDDRERIDMALLEDGGDVRLRDGLIVRFLVKVDFYTNQGRYQVSVTDIDLAYTTGTIHQNREAIIRALDADGILEKNVSLPWPTVPLKIGLITADGSDACADFLHEIERSGYGFQVDLHTAQVQGARTEVSMLRALDYFAKRASEYDAIAIVRGGGARSDLAYFDTEPIGRAVCEHPLKVIVGVGHQRDNCLLDAIAHSEKTPTAAAQFFVERVKAYVTRQRELSDQIFHEAFAIIADAHEEVSFNSEHALRVIGDELEDHTRRLDRIAYGISNKSSDRLSGERRKFQRLALAVPSAASRRVDVARTHVEHARRRASVNRLSRATEARDRQVDQLAERLDRGSNRALEQIGRELDRKQDSLRMLDPRRILERGFALLRDAEGQVVRDAEDVADGEALHVRLARGEMAVRVESSTPPRQEQEKESDGDDSGE